MIWLYAVTSPSGNRLALLISALRVIGILGFALLAGIFIIPDAYLETTLSILTTLAWIAATTEAMDRLQSSSASRFTAGASGFLDFGQSRVVAE